MAETYFPFDSGAGSAVTEANWYDMAPGWQSSGVRWGDGGSLYVQPTGGMVISLGTGSAWVYGGFYRNSAAKTFTIASNSSGLTRIDSVVLTLDTTGNTIVATVVQGTPSSTPVAPSLFGNQMKLADITVPNGATNLVIGTNVNTKRQWCSVEGPLSYSPTFNMGGGSPTTITTIAGNADPDNNNAFFRVLPGNLCWININQLCTFGGSSNSYPLYVSLPFPPRYMTELSLGADNAPGYGIFNASAAQIEMYPQAYSAGGNWAIGNFWVRACGVYQIGAV